MAAQPVVAQRHRSLQGSCRRGAVDLLARADLAERRSDVGHLVVDAAQGGAAFRGDETVGQFAGPSQNGVEVAGPGRVQPPPIGRLQGVDRHRAQQPVADGPPGASGLDQAGVHEVADGVERGGSSPSDPATRELRAMSASATITDRATRASSSGSPGRSTLVSSAAHSPARPPEADRTFLVDDGVQR